MSKKNNANKNMSPDKPVAAAAKKPKRIAMYVIYDKDGILDGFRKYYLQELRKVTDHIVAIVCGSITPESRKELEELSDEIFVRRNFGLLAYAWIEGIEFIGWDTLSEYDELLMLNDSFFGPFYPLQDMFDACEKSDADFYGAFKNYEDIRITQIAGRPLSGGHFNGSICYFYIIKSKLLHSPEFKNYWSQRPDVTCDFDTYFYSEIDFFYSVKQWGYKIDAYQSNKFEGYMFDNLTHNMEGLIKEDKIPFARIRPFGTDVKDQSYQINYGKDPRRTLEYIDKHTDYDVNLIWDFMLRTKNLTHIYNQLQLKYVVPKNCVEKPFNYNKKIAVILHIYYEDLAELIAEYCTNFVKNTDFYITTTSEETEKAIINAFKNKNLNFECKVRPNVGVAMSTLWVTYADVVTKGDYEYICYFHDKKSPYGDYSVQGEQFAVRCYDNLFGTEEIVKNIINLFEDNPRLGMIGPPEPYNGAYFMCSSKTWYINQENTKQIAKKLNINVDINPNIVPIAPLGDMFWFRADALKKAIGHNLDYDFFDVEYKNDGTILHAIERIYGYAVQDAGYYYADVINSDDARSDLINFQYMLHQIWEILLSKGQFALNYDHLKNILCNNNVAPLSRSQVLKNKIREKTPKGLWKIMSKVYHLFKRH